MRKRLSVLVAIIFIVIGAIVFTEPLTAKAATAKLNKEELNMDIGDRIKLKVKNTKKAVKWKSDNSAVAKVTKKGNVYALSAGECTITAKVGKKTLSCKVVVTDSVLELFDTSVTINGITIPLNSTWEFAGAERIANIYQYSISEDEFKWVCAQVAELTEAEAEEMTSTEESFSEACVVVSEAFIKGFDTKEITYEVIKEKDGYLGRVAGTCVSNGNDITVIVFVKVKANNIVLIMGMEAGEPDPYLERIVRTICIQSVTKE